MILEDATFEAYGYYSSALKPQSVKKILVVCDGCGKPRAIPKDGYHSLCKSCAHKGLKHSDETKRRMSEAQKGDKNHNFGKTTPNEVKHKIGEAEKGDNHHNWQGGPIERICKVCGKTFYAKQSVVDKGHGIYCSKSCTAKARIHKARPEKTAPEKAFEAICKKYLLPFTFVGNGALWLGNANPDFIHNTKKIALEVFGYYWHSLLVNRNVRYTGTVEGRTAQLKAEGYKTIILWESDLKRKDAEEFILHEMCKEGII